MLNEIKKVFEVDPSFDIDDIENICETPYHEDDEPLEVTLPFLGKRWDEITPGIWQQNNAASSFLTGKAYYYYFPSIIAGVYRDIDKMELILMWLLFDIERIYQYKILGETTDWEGVDLTPVQEFTYNRINQLNKEQLGLLKQMFFYLESICYFSAEDHDVVKKTLDYLIDSKD